MTIAEKILTVADNTPAVAEVVNATKAAATGAVIRADDVLNIEHPLQVQLKSKNLINVGTLDSSVAGDPVIFEGELTGTFCFSCLFNYGDAGAAGAAQFAFIVDGTTIYMTRGSSDRVSKTFSGTLTKITYTNWGNFEGTVTEVQLEHGSTFTGYVPYTTDFSGKTANIYGKNLFNKYATQYSGAYCSSAIVDDELVVKTTSSGAYISANFDIPNGDLLVGKTVTISGEWAASGANNGCLRLSWTNKDNIHGIVSDIGMTSTSGVPITKTIGAKPANADKLALFIYGNFSGTGSIGATVTYREVQLEIGSLATDCQPYAEQVGIADADGRVKGLKSVSPTMSIVADSVVEVKYFPTSAADTYEKYQQLKAAEAALIEFIEEV